MEFIAFGQLVLHVELVVHHIGEETLPHVAVAENGKSQQGEHRQYDAPAMCQSEVEGGAQQGIGTSLVFALSGGADFNSRVQLAVCHQRHVHQRQHPTQQ